MSDQELSDQYAHAREAVNKMSHRESDENYHAVVYQMGKYRVIECKHGIQWIIQQRDEKNMAGARWRGFKYTTTKSRLITLMRAYFGGVLPMEIVELPETLKRGEV